MSRVFISYRRLDSAGYAGRIHDHLSKHLGKSTLFMDIDNIQPGDDFVQKVEDAIGSCEIVLVLMGPHWLSAMDRNGNRRLDNPNDPVRLEIITALRLNKRIIPVLLDNSNMPCAEDIHPDLHPLLLRNAVEITSQRFEYDIERLATLLISYRSSVNHEPSYNLSVESKQRSFRRNWAIGTLTICLWCLVTLIMYWSAWDPIGDQPNNLLCSVTWAVLLPIIYIILAAFWPLMPHDAAFWTFFVHIIYSGLLWGTDAYHEYMRILGTTQKLSLLDVTVYGGFVLIPSILVGIVAGIICWERHRRNRRMLHQTNN